MSTKIEWVDETWNPVTGCTRVSPGCDRCYAERFAERFRGVPGHHFERGFDVVLRPHRLADPPRWKTSKRIFVDSMSDVFHRDVPDDYVDAIVATMRATPRHTYHVLTKRPERMRRYLSARPPTPDHIWFGVSVESDAYAWRADMLREVAHVPRFLSLEPLLGPVGALSLEGIDWVILGGESGPGARPLDADWVRDVRDRCERGAIPFFFKQWGGARKSYEACVLDGREHLAFPIGRASRANVVRVGRLRRDCGISVARPTALGNPFPIATEADRPAAIARFRATLPALLRDDARARAQFARIVAAARAGDVTLLCWCAPKACHADAIAECVRAELAANSQPPPMSRV